MPATTTAPLQQTHWRALLEPSWQDWLAKTRRRRKKSPFTVGSCDQAALGYLLSGLLATWKAEQIPGRVWIFCPHARLRDRLTEELSFWKTPVCQLPDPSLELEGELVDPDREAERASTLHRLAGQKTTPVLLSRQSWQAPAPNPDVAEQAERALEIEQELDMDEFVSWLEERDYTEEGQIFGRLQYARRGGVIDFYPPNAMHPIRLEFFGDELESIREFSVESQTTTRRIDSYDIGQKAAAPTDPLSNWQQKDDLCVAIDEDDLEIARLFLTDAPSDDVSAALYPSPAAGFEAGDFVVTDSTRTLFLEQIKDWAEAGYALALVAPTKAEQKRFLEVIERPADTFHLCEGRLSKGFVAPDQKLAVISTLEIFGRQHLPGGRQNQRLAKQRQAAAIAGVHELNEGEFVVHADYGIGEFIGLVENDEGQELLGIEYQDSATLHVPIDQSHLVSRYIGVGGGKPRLNKLGDKRWKTSKKTAEASVLDYAANLLSLQAERDELKGYAHPPDNQWMQDFEAAFPYVETPDQLRAIEAAKQDMESPRPMDRLICGDVGFGKTEVAIRAAFKAVTGGTQVAILAPTTVLAEQHWRNFRERMSDFPIRIDLLSRLQTPAEARNTLEGLANGDVDIVIGTHRLLSGKIDYKKIGLLVVDEEQRFGVRHKEQLKERFRLIDVLTLSATPIPRTLYLSLMGARDMSTIDTPPPNRLPVQTSIATYDERLIRNAMRRELTRGGQIFFLHNRVKTIEGMKKRINDLVPEANVTIGHGQMDKTDLEQVMHTFVEGKADVLLATTIIESGIDIPNANTIIIDRADRFGLADLYQLRGRVGRAGRRAYAILLLPRDTITGGDSRKRLNAIQQYTELGSGFKIAMRDLEIRGAGSLLGTKQSGHIAAVGFELYCQLLQQSVENLQGKAPTKRSDASVRLDFVNYSEGQASEGDEKATISAYFPRSYAPDDDLRVAAYRALASVRTEKDLKALSKNWRDRFGRFPAPVETLLEVNRLRVIASTKGLESLEIKNDRFMASRNGDYLVPQGQKFPKLTTKSPKQKLQEAIKLTKSL